MYQDILSIPNYQFFGNSREEEDIKEILDRIDGKWTLKAHLRFKVDSSSVYPIHEYEKENITTSVEITIQRSLTDESESFDPIVQSPPKQVLTSMKVELSAKKLAKKLPKPDIFADEQDFGEPITVQPPPKRVLASMNVELSTKDFKKKLPNPVIFPESEVES